jgi:hypothetical protein
MLSRALLVARLVIASAGFSLFCSCGGTSGFGGSSGGQSKKRVKDPKPASGSTSQSSAATTADSADAPKRADADSPKQDDENEPATHPAQISGAFLVDCSWQEDDGPNQRGIVGCTVVGKEDARTLPASEVDVVSLTLASGDSSTSVEPLEGTEAHAIRFPIGYGYYGQDIQLDAQFIVASAAEGAADVQAIEVNDLSIAALPATPPAEALTAFYDTGAFKLGDDGIGISPQCPAIELTIGPTQGGKVLELVFEAQVQASFTLSFFRVCGNGSGGDGVSQLARWEVVDANGSARGGAAIPASTDGTGTPDTLKNPATPTSTSVAAIPALEPGIYTLRVYSAVGSGSALDDSSVENLKIAGPGFVYKSLTFKK